MSGFVGFADAKHPIDKEKTIESMMETITHRGGPDSGSHHVDERIAFNQPMYNEDRSIVLVFNGKIYNFQQLRTELLEKGHQFKSNADCEVILHGYEEYGMEIVQKLRGMFAFAIWDGNKEALFLARDHFGIKPLYYSQNTTDQSFIFGSEIKSFLQYPAFTKELNKTALKPYLTFQYSVLDETFFKGVYKLRPGHYMMYKKGSIDIKKYWEPVFAEKNNSLEYYKEQINRIVKESVDLHKNSDVPVGAFLSGGIDSSYVTSLSLPNKTFSVGFQDYETLFNETNLAADLSDLLGIENYKRMVTADECFQLLPTIQYHMDEPQSNPSSVPLYFLAELASKHVTVVLSGEGADEIFGGYIWYQNSPNLNKYKRMLPNTLRRPLSLLAKKLPQNRITAFLVKGGQKVEERFIGQAKIFEEEEALQVLRSEYKNGPSVHEITKKHYDRVKDKDDLTKMQYLDLMLWQPGDILLKADKMSSAHSIEIRVPFLDQQVMAIAAELPSHMRVNEINTKYALREAAKDVLPKEWANRPKVGFPVPIRHWLQEEKYYSLVKEMFQSDLAKEFFSTDELMTYLDDHYTGKRNCARKIWTVYVFLIWYRKFFVELQ